MTISKLGGFKALIRLLDRTTDDQVAYRAAGALFNICFGNAAHKKEIVDQGGLVPLTKMILTSTHTKVLEYSLGTVNMLAHDVADSVKHLTKDPEVTSALFRHMTGLSSTQRLELEARGILTEIAQVANLVMDQKFIPSLLHWMQGARKQIDELTKEEQQTIAGGGQLTADNHLSRAKLTTVNSSLTMLLEKVKVRILE